MYCFNTPREGGVLEGGCIGGGGLVFFATSTADQKVVKISQNPCQNCQFPCINTHILPFLAQNIAPGPSKTRIWYWFLHKKVIQGYIIGILLKKYFGGCIRGGEVLEGGMY